MTGACACPSRGLKIWPPDFVLVRELLHQLPRRGVTSTPTDVGVDAKLTRNFTYTLEPELGLETDLLGQE